MQTRHVVALIITIAVLALALGATIGYSLSSGRIYTTTQTGKTSTTTQTYTVTTTSIFLGNSSTTVTNSPNSSSQSVQTYTVGSQTYITFLKTLTACCNNTSVGATFDYPVSINYTGSWNLVYSVEYGNISGNLNGSGNHEIWIKFDVTGYVQYTLCANATKLDSSQDNLTLMVLTTTKSTTASSTEVCSTMAV